MRRPSFATASFSIVSALCAAIVVPAAGCAGAPDDDPGDDRTSVTWQALDAPGANARFNLVKSYEAQLAALGQPAPKPVVTINMGSFDAATGLFTGLKKYCYREPDVLRLICEYPEEYANALDIDLRFTITNATGAASATFTNELGEAIAAGGTTTSVVVRVRRGTQFRWTVSSSGRSYSDQITLDRPVSVGAFSVEVLPITFLYDPPDVGSFVSWAEYSASQTWGSSVSTELVSSTSKRKVDANTTDLTGFKSAVDLGAGLARLVPTYGAPVAGVLGALSTALGTVTHSTVDGTESRVTGRLDLFSTESVTYQTRNLVGLSGPGRGDRIVYAMNVKLAWVIAAGIPTLTVLGWTDEGAPTADDLRQDRAQIRAGGVATRTHLSARALDALLALEPAVTGSPAAASFPGSRFRYLGHIFGNGTERRSITDSKLSTDATSTMTFKSDILDSRPGWLSFLGIGVTEESTTTLTTSHRVTDQVSVGQSTSQSFEMNGAYDIELYRDVVFGGFLPIRSNSCVGDCGGQDDSGCWCDSLCTGYGDCCPDYQDVCVAP